MLRNIKWFAQDSTTIGGKSLDKELLSPYLLSFIFVSFKSLKCNEHESMNTTETASSVQFSCSVMSCLTLCDPMNCSTPGLPVHHQLLEFTQTHVH